MDVRTATIINLEDGTRIEIDDSDPNKFLFRIEDGYVTLCISRIELRQLGEFFIGIGG